MPGPVRVLFLADSHLGFDLPARPRVERRRRGHDFLANYQLALAPALNGEVDFVVHGGDVFDRSRVLPTVAYQAFEPLRRIAEHGTPVFIVPGNHERSRMPHAHLLSHPRVHVFDRPRTFAVDVRGVRVALAGFPFERRDARGAFPSLLNATGWAGIEADVRLLCVHHCVEGATVGPADYMFTTSDDTLRLQDMPAGFAGVLSGHIHRHQVLTRDLRGRPIAAPVLYPGSIERTALAEIGEEKGYLMLALEVQLRWEFKPLPARPMIRHEIVATGLTGAALIARVRGIVRDAPADAVLALRVTGTLTESQWRCLSAAQLRAFVPATMNVEVIPDGGFVRDRALAPSDAEAGQSVQLSLMGEPGG